MKKIYLNLIICFIVILSINGLVCGVKENNNNTESGSNHFEIMSNNPFDIEQANLIGYWNFDDSNDIGKDYSEYGNDGFVNGATLVNGINGNALYFDGIDDYVDVGNDSSLKCDLPLSISCWINLQEIDGTTGVIFQNDKWDYPHGYYGFRLRYKGEDGRLKIAYGDGGLGGPQDRRGKTGSTIITPNIWYHVVGIIRGPADIDIYINGSNDGGYYSDGYGGDISYSESSGYISQDGWSKGFFNGILDEISVYNKALSEQEISSLYFESFKPVFMLGKIDKINAEQNRFIFEAENLIIIKFSPFNVNIYSDNEKIIISNEYFGVLSVSKTLGFFKALIQ